MKRAKIEQMLPAVVHRTLRPGDPLGALLDVMEELHEPSEAALADLGRQFDTHRADDAFVPFLASWVDLDHLFESGDAGRRLPGNLELGHLRELVAAATELSRWRGTERGMILFLETATGQRGFEVDEAVRDASGQVRPYHMRIVAPAVCRPRRALLQQIIEREKPAYVTYELVFDGADTPPVPPPAPPR